MALLRRLSPVPRPLYTEWWWPPSPTVYRTVPSGYESFENLLVPEVEPAHDATFLWAHGFRLVGGGSGHVGLQVDRGVKGATFMIEGGRAANGHDFGSSGMIIPFNWMAGREYALLVRTVEEGHWSAIVQDQSTGDQVTIGVIQVPLEWRRLGSWSVMSTEYLGAPLANCHGLPHSSVVFGTPTANDGRVEPERFDTRLGDGNCDVSWSEVTSHGVRHLMGRA